MDKPRILDQHAALQQRISELEAAQARLQSECEGLRRFYLQAPLAYQSLDGDGYLLEVNHAWLHTLGYTREEVIGKHFTTLLPPELVEHFAVNFPKFKAAGEIVGGGDIAFDAESFDDTCTTTDTPAGGLGDQPQVITFR